MCLKRQEDLGAIFSISKPQIETICLSTKQRHKLAKTAPNSSHKNNFILSARVYLRAQLQMTVCFKNGKAN